MQYKGRQLTGPRKLIIPIIRSEEEGGTIFLIAQGVTDMKPFEALCPSPTAPKVQLPGGKTREDVEDKGYKSEVDRWWKKRSSWIVLKSLEATEDLKWDRVNMSDPNTYEEYEKELTESGFSQAEIMRIINNVLDVNGLNEGLVEEARQSFLNSQAAQRNGSSSPTVAV